MMHAQACGDRAQALATGGEEPPQQPPALQLLQPAPPALGTAPQPFEDPVELGRDRSLAVAEKPAGVIDQERLLLEF